MSHKISKKFIAVCFHLGYNQRFTEFTPYIDNIVACCHNTDIYITYRENNDPSDLCHSKYPNAHVMKATNGCDTGAFLLQIKSMITSGKKYDYVFKIHTKSNNSFAKNWTHELLNKTTGTVSHVKKNIRLFNKHHKIGMIGGKRWILTREINFNYFHEICQRNHILIDGQFIGGTIFWVRFDILQQFFKNVNIDQEYALCEQGKPSEPSYTHAWERIYGLIVNTCGYTIHGV